jgi:hypothetical protein
MRTDCLALITVFSVTLGIGCKDKGPPPAEVTGVVEYDGQPVPTGMVLFLSPGGGSEAGGAITDGRYHVYPESKLMPGTYRVEIRWPKPTGEKVQQGYMMVDERKEGLPEKYNANSELTATVKSGENTVDFKLAK